MVVESKVEVPQVPQVELTIFWTCVLFFAQVFRSSQSTSQVSREKSPMVVVGGLSHRPSLMSEFSQSATTTRAEPTPRDATYLPVAASSASSSELNRTTDGSRRYLPTYPTTTTTTTVQCQRAIDETQWLWLWLCLCRWDATNGGESARAREQYRESEPNRVFLRSRWERRGRSGWCRPVWSLAGDPSWPGKPFREEGSVRGPVGKCSESNVTLLADGLHTENTLNRNPRWMMGVGRTLPRKGDTEVCTTPLVTICMLGVG